MGIGIPNSQSRIQPTFPSWYLVMNPIRISNLSIQYVSEMYLVEIGLIPQMSFFDCCWNEIHRFQPSNQIIIVASPVGDISSPQTLKP